jgi:hypothetical protein
MSIAEQVRNRGITEVLHFTTNKGVLGVLDGKALKARARLHHDERLEYIFQPNAASRDKDLDWLDYVNLSISRINANFFSASGNWHRNKNLWWCVLSFSPEILSHEGVFFSTTNNIYTGVKRAAGEAGFEKMFAQMVTRWSTNVIARDSSTPSNFTTCIQAEVLYPGEVSTEFLQKIYVTDETSADELAGQLAMLRHRDIPIEIAPKIFT